MNRSHKRPIVFAVRDFPSGCGTQTDDSSTKAFKNPRTSDVVVKNHLTEDTKPQGTSVTKESSADQDQDHDVAVPNGVLRQEREIRNSTDHDHDVTVPEVSTLGKEGKIRNSNHDPSPREKVLEVLRLFKQVYKQLERKKEAKRGGDLFDATSRIDIKTLDVIENMGKQVNSEMRIGSVPGIEIGDEFQYKTELRVVGLHSRTMCGIDYMRIGDMRIATSIVASEGYGYNDMFDSGVMVYTGEGGNVISKQKKTEDQKLTKGNLALANSVRQKSQVRVIRGEERWNRKGKRYVYDGLYTVEKYWVEKDVRGKTVYKFKLCRIPGQASLT